MIMLAAACLPTVPNVTQCLSRSVLRMATCNMRSFLRVHVMKVSKSRCKHVLVRWSQFAINSIVKVQIIKLLRCGAHAGCE